MPLVRGRYVLGQGLLMGVLVGCQSGGWGDGRTDEERSGDSPRGVAVSEYCERFAELFSVHHAVEYQARTASTSKRPDAKMWITNAFQPSNARFTSEYDCRFRARNREGHVREFTVGLFLTGTVEFARYTQWKELQTVPIEYVMDTANGRAGYGVFKYLRSP